jgi:hypothetical protein
VGAEDRRPQSRERGAQRRLGRTRERVVGCVERSRRLVEAILEQFGVRHGQVRGARRPRALPSPRLGHVDRVCRQASGARVVLAGAGQQGQMRDRDQCEPIAAGLRRRAAGALEVCFRGGEVSVPQLRDAEIREREGAEAGVDRGGRERAVAEQLAG